MDFQVGTGRMPAASPGAQAPRSDVQFTEEEIAATGGLRRVAGPGPAIPAEEQLDFSEGDVGEGGELFRTNCAMCHNFAGSGGALTRGKYAPPLRGVSRRKHIYEAMLTGPQSMPVFSDQTMTPENKQDIIAFLKTTENEPSPGGALGKLGPVTEGLFVWIVGLGLIGCAVWLGAEGR